MNDRDKRRENLERRAIERERLAVAPPDDRASAASEGASMRRMLAAFVDGLMSKTTAVRMPRPARELVVQGDGHFHLVPELFLQVAGATRFDFPHESLDLQAGQALVLPPRLLHGEHVLRTDDDAAFCNVVVYADATALTCHVAREQEPGRPGIHYLEARRHVHAARIQEWLADAARLAGEAAQEPAAQADRVDVQVRALVASACAGVLRVLDSAKPDAAIEPALVSRTRMWIQNQLGDHQLSVARLAEQAGCTPDHLSRLFNNACGEHLAAYIVRKRMERAAGLLGESAMAGKEVAWACGFSSQSYFISTFRKHFGITPKAWCDRRAADLGEFVPVRARRAPSS